MTRNQSGRANRVAPDGSAHDVADRGTVWGNRGQLLDAGGRLARHSQGANWIVCVLAFHGRRRTQWQPRRLTELYFLDEATGLAAGHRPCGECRFHAYQRYKAAWLRAFGLDSVSAREMDRALQAERLRDRTVHPTHEADLAGLPDGAMVARDAESWLVRGDRLYRWTFAGYDAAEPRLSFPARVEVRTPPSTVAVLKAGYVAQVHPSVVS